MATRYYVSNAAAGYTPATKRGSWSLSASTVTGKLGPKSGAATTTTPAGQALGGTWCELTGRWISDPIAAHTFTSETVQWVLGEKTSSVTNSATSHVMVHIYLTTGDSDTVRATLLSNQAGGTSLTATATGTGDGTFALGSVSSLNGDRIVVEIGWQKNGTATAIRTNTLNYGATGATDLTNGSTAVTTNPGWVEFSGTIGAAITNSSPTVALNSPSDTGTVTTTTPTLTFTGTDSDSDDIEYNVQVSDSSSFVVGSGGTDSYSETNLSNNTTLNTTTVAAGQSFTAVGGVLSSATFSLRWSGSAPTGNATAKVYAHSGTYGTSSVGTGSALATSDNLDVSTLTSTNANYTLNFTGTNQIGLTNGGNYVVMFEYTGNGTALVVVGNDTTSPTHGGNLVTRSSTGTWSAFSTQDSIFYVTTTAAGSVLLDKVSTTDAGFVDVTNGADTHPFASTNQISYTVQAGDALTNGSTYYWRVRGIDPSGSNTYGSWATTRSFTVSVSGGTATNLFFSMF